MRDKDIDAILDGASRRPLALRRPAGAARGAREEIAARFWRAGRRGPGLTAASARARAMRSPRRERRRTPPIESSSSAPSTPWAACSRTDCRSVPAATPPERSGSPLAGSPHPSHSANPRPRHVQAEARPRSPQALARARGCRAAGPHARTPAPIGAVVLLGDRHHRLPARLRDAAPADPVDVPIEIPRRDLLPPLAMPPARSPSGRRRRRQGQRAAAPASASNDCRRWTRADAGS